MRPRKYAVPSVISHSTMMNQMDDPQLSVSLWNFIFPLLSCRLTGCYLLFSIKYTKLWRYLSCRPSFISSPSISFAFTSRQKLRSRLLVLGYFHDHRVIRAVVFASALSWPLVIVGKVLFLYLARFSQTQAFEAQVNYNQWSSPIH